jgi:hypothetical protein
MTVVILVCLGAASTLLAQRPEVHYLHHGIMPPGAIGSRQLQRGGPLPGYFQPVDITAPTGVMVSMAVEGNFDQSQQAPRKAGLLIGQVYRLRVTNVPRFSGMEVFPTVEVIDRLYSPAGQELRFAIPVQLTQADLALALAGKFVTRVIYLEDPDYALPSQEGPGGQNWYEAEPGSDPLAVADSLGRPVAILRLGGRIPDDNQGPDSHFLFGSPPMVNYESGKQLPVAGGVPVRASKPALVPPGPLPSRVVPREPQP